LDQFVSVCGEWLSNASTTTIDSLLKLRHKIFNRVFHHYHLAANSYFRALQLSKQNEHTKYDESSILCTLRIIRMLAKHPLEMKQIFIDGFNNTPTHPWKSIIPQLFSRLNHDESIVRELMTSLLSRMDDHMIVYPVVVATTNIMTTSVATEDDVDEDEDLNEDSEGIAKQSYNQVLDVLLQRSPSKVRDTQLLVVELRRITLLWDELWLGILNQHQADINKRLNQLHDEAKRIKQNSSLSEEEKLSLLDKQNKAILRPVVHALKKVLRVTSQQPDTPHETRFHDDVQPMVTMAFDKLLNPDNIGNPKSCWAGFKQLHNYLESKYRSRASNMLKLDEISPKLMNMKNTSVPIPGVTSNTNSVSIQGCSASVPILPTKTKPKKMQFVGSDGRRYTYLFKGLENLHLDERLMQFLKSSTRLLRISKHTRGFQARNYAVTPLGPRSGLIQWVTNATPLFTLYKKWQQRQANKNKNGSSSPNQPTLRPSEVFYHKLTKHGINIERPRKEWSKQVLRKVYDELCKETPDYLLQRELWCSSTSDQENWFIRKKYISSMAVMSMLGYIIGLGDRHLDNVLIDLETGEVVHIDYNVCFDKGKNLRVPELVPFRLTQNLVNAMGISGVQGDFIHNCEQVIRTLRKGKDTLLSLMEAFTHDPHVEWGVVDQGYTGAVYGGENPSSANVEDKNWDREINRSLLSSRVFEMKEAWYKNRDDMLKWLPSLIKDLKEYQNHSNISQQLQDKNQVLLEAKADVKQALQDPRHSFNNLPQRWISYQQQQDQKDQLVHLLQDKIAVCGKNVMDYVNLLAILSSNQLDYEKENLQSQKFDLGDCPFKLSYNFLQNTINLGKFVLEIEALEKELLNACGVQKHVFILCLETLIRYKKIAGEYPPKSAVWMHNDAVWENRLVRCCDNLLNSNVVQLQQDVQLYTSDDSKNYQLRQASRIDRELRCEVRRLNQELQRLLKLKNKEVKKEDNSQIFSTINKFDVRSKDLVQALCHTILQMSRQIVAMETHVVGSGHRLVEKVSQEGVWYLEEVAGLLSNGGNVLKVWNNINEQKLKGDVTKVDTSVARLFECRHHVAMVDNVLQNLLKLYSSFKDMILPEACKFLQCENTSVNSLVQDISNLLQGFNTDQVLKQLMGALRSRDQMQNGSSGNLEGMQNGHISENIEKYQNAINQVENLRLRYDALEKDYINRPQRSGEFLLQGFKIFFDKVVNSFEQLLINRNQINCPQNWFIVDQLKISGELQKFKNLSSNMELVKAVMFVKQIHAMHSFFTLARNNAFFMCIDRTCANLNGHFNTSQQFYSEESLCKPIKLYLTFVVQELLIGLPSESLAMSLCACLDIMDDQIQRYAYNNPGKLLVSEDVCKTYLDEQNSEKLACLSLYFTQVNDALKIQERTIRVQNNYESTQQSFQRATDQVTRFQWLNEDLLQDGKINMLNTGMKRSDIILELKQVIVQLNTSQDNVKHIQDEISQQHQTIKKRLGWAGGSDPNLKKILQDVDVNVEKRDHLLLNQLQNSKHLIDICSKAVSFESTRLHANDDERLQIVAATLQLCNHVCSNAAISNFTDMERSLVEVLAPNQQITTADWLKTLSDKIVQAVNSNKQQRHLEEKKMTDVKLKLGDKVDKIKLIHSVHSKLLVDVKPFLKTMAKEEETTSSDSDEDLKITRYMEDYRKTSELLLKTLKSVQVSQDVRLYSDPIIETLQTVLNSVDGLYEGLIAFATPEVALPSNHVENGVSNHLTNGVSSGDHIEGKTNKKKRKVANSAKDRRNATSCWRKVKCKLEGREPDTNKICGAREMVAKQVAIATDPDKLSRMFQGWTSWV